MPAARHGLAAGRSRPPTSASCSPSTAPSWLACGFGTAASTCLGSTAGLATGLGQVTALLGTYLALVGILLMARVPAIDHVVGSDRLMAWHRWLGFGTLWLLLAHFAFTTIGWAMASGRTVVDELLDMLSTWDVLIATVGLGTAGARGRDLHPGGTAAARLRDLVRPAPLRLPRHRPGLPAPGDDGLRPRRRPARAVVLGRPLRGDVRAAHRLPGAGTHPALAAPSPARGQRRARGAGRRLHLPRRAAPRAAPGPRRPVLPGPLPDRRRLVASAPLLHLCRAQRRLAAPDHQGPRRRLAAHAVDAHRRAGLHRRALRRLHGRHDPAARGWS